MEQTTLQQRIEERAKNRLLKEMLKTSNIEQSVANFINFGKPDMYFPRLDVRVHYQEYGRPREQIKMYNDYSQEVFDTLLPKYISMVTDEILAKVDEIDYLLSEKRAQEQD